MKRSNDERAVRAGASTIQIGDAETVTIPPLAPAAESKQLASRLTKLKIGELSACLPKEAARAIAGSVVDPLQVIESIDQQRFERQDTPSGKQLVIVRCRVWTAGASIDGGNGRTRLKITLKTPEGPWPQPQSSHAPILAYRFPSVDALKSAVIASAREIRNSSLSALLQQNPRGIWNPPTLVVGAFKVGKDPELHVIHTAEGSSRLAAAQELIGVPFDGPISHLGDIRGFLGAERGRIVREIEAAPGASSRLLEKLVTAPARIVIAVLNADGTLCTESFANVVTHYIESVHIEPKSWEPAEQGNAIGERLVDALRNAGALTSHEADEILQRDSTASVGTPPDKIGVILIRAVTNPAYNSVVREVLLEDNGANLTSKRRAAAVGPLLLRIFRNTKDRQQSAEAALLREHLPAELQAGTWRVTDRSIDELLFDAELAHDENPGSWSEASRELVARGVAPMAVLGLVLSDQGQAVNNIAELRGHVSKVMEGLAKSKGGLRTIADAIRRATSGGGMQPVRRNFDGSEIMEKTRDGGEAPARYVLSDAQDANLKVRQLAFTGGVMPAPRSPKAPSPSPEEQFRGHQVSLMQYINEAVKHYESLLMVAAPNGDCLIDTRNLDNSLLGAAPSKLMDLRDGIKSRLTAEALVQAPHSDGEMELHDVFA